MDCRMDSDKEIMNKNASEGSEETISEFTEDIEKRFYSKQIFKRNTFRSESLLAISWARAISGKLIQKRGFGR